jgi:tetratricopeptide (TPR) repeat protein
MNANKERRLPFASTRVIRGFSAVRSRTCVCGLLLLVGCGTTKEVKQANRGVEDYFNGDFPRAMAMLEPVARNTDENYVLNNLRLGSAALTAYDLPEAEAAFLRAWEVINAGGVNSGGRSVAAVWIDEKLKIWKGEPYERALASFYLGLTYYMQRDYNNARASFENSLFKLRDYADDKRRVDYSEQESTFALAYVMLGRCWQKLDREDLAAEAFGDAARLQPRLRGLADSAKHAEANVLLVVDFGFGPRKVTDYDGSIVGFAPAPASARRLPLPRVIVNDAEYPLGNAAEPTIDTVMMAADRRWQSIDTIRTVKTTVGTGLIAGGAGYGLYKAGRGDFRGEDAAVVAGLIAAGAILKATSTADVRQWEMAPRTVFVLPLALPPGTHDITVSFPDAGNLQQSWRGLIAPESGDATYYFRMNRWWPGPFEWPPAVMR